MEQLGNDFVNSNCIRAKRAKTSVNIRENSDASGSVVYTLPQNAYVLTVPISSAIDHVMYMNNSTLYVGYAYSSNFEAL